MTHSKNNDEIEKWKNKYYNLFDEQEKNDQLFQEKESVLRKIVTRLAQAAKGYNSGLDPHLESIQKLVKNSATNDKLKNKLDTFSDLLLHLSDEPFPLDKAKNDTAQKIETVIVSKQLLHLLAGTKIPGNYDSQASLLKNKLQTELDPEAFQVVLEKSVELLLSIKQHASLEQEDIEDFLSSITRQLTELGVHASSASVASQENAITRNKLDQAVSRQMKDLQQSSVNETSLDLLKQLITTRLEEIAQQINEHKQEEDQQHTKTQNQLKNMNSKIQVMESESKDLRGKLQIARDKALRDQLTGLPNRRAYEEQLSTEVARWQRYKTPLTMIIWDVDHFKKINDNYGHKAGDKTLLLISSLLTKNCRQTDFVARFGGEEFVMLLPDTSKESGFIMAEKIRTIIEKSGFNAGGKAISVTISCGITQYLDTDSFDSLFERADQGLYSAKNKGRNQCAVI
jgi:diguanylate cyclase